MEKERDHLQTQLDSVKAIQVQAQDHITQLEASVASAREDGNAAAETVGQLTAQLKDLNEETEQLRGLKTTLEDLKVVKEATEKEMAEVRKALEEMKEDKEELEMKAEDLRVALEEVSRRQRKALFEI